MAVLVSIIRSDGTEDVVTLAEARALRDAGELQAKNPTLAAEALRIVDVYGLDYTPSGILCLA